VVVREQPAIQASSTPSECGASTGSIFVSSAGAQQTFAISENIDTVSVLGSTITNLAAGNYTVSYEDANGCRSKDTLVTIGAVNNTNAAFSALPQSGSAPLEVTITNQSTGVSNFEWYLNNAPQNNAFTGFSADTSGSYEIMLIAWQYAPECADTAYQTVVVYDSLVVQIPNVFTPNNDGINESFSITSNQAVTCAYVITNRWGNVMAQGTVSASAGVSTSLWNGANASEGVYFYNLEIRVLDVDCTENCSLKKTGFLTVGR
jgi:gliding motility-associated-like protein